MTTLLIGMCIAIYAKLIASNGISMVMLGMIIPIGLIYLLSVFKNPAIGLWSLFVLNYFVLGIIRYFPAPLGLAMDSLMVLTHLAIFIKFFNDKSIYQKARGKLFVVSGIWFIYALFQLVNPEAVSRVAWFYAMRGVALYMFLTVPLVMILLDNRKSLEMFLKLWMAFAVLAVLKGLMQKYIGVDPVEQRWLDGGGAVTHVLFGKLRVFSFFSDAGQYGASMGHIGIVSLILALKAPTQKKKLIYAVASAFFLYGMLISGTRGANAVPLGGIFLYVIMTNNVKILTAGGIFAILMYIFIFHTSIGQGNYDIARFRTAFNKDDPSLQVRLENQRKLKGYMASRPIGGGIGSSGNWGMRFSPNTFLANTPTDSWYVMIWVEQGVAGLYLHLAILFFIVIRSTYVIMYKIKDPWLQGQLMALNAGLLGIMIASYGNAVFGQLPTGIIIYFSMAFLFMAEKLDKEGKKTAKIRT